MKYKKNLKRNILYLSFDGIMEPLGDSQILQYLIINSNYFNFHLISFEKTKDIKNKKKLNSYKNLLKNNLINWVFFKYSKKFKYLSTVIMIIILFSKCLLLFLKNKIEFVHLRSYLPGIAILPLKLIFKFKIIFDIRGFYTLEKIERNNLKSKIIIKFLNLLERNLVKNSYKIITLTNEAKKIFISKYKIPEKNLSVIRTCVNCNYFKIDNFNYNAKKNITFGFLGSLNAAYDFDKIIIFFKRILKLHKQAKILFFLEDKDNYILNKLISYKLDPKTFEIRYVEQNRLVEYISIVDFALFFLKDHISVKASFPTKIGEFLSLGIPIVTNEFNKDITEIIDNNKIGIKIKDDNYIIDLIYRELQGFFKNQQIKNNCRNYAINNLSHEIGARKYLDIYNSINS